jgi:peroxiredoxin
VRPEHALLRRSRLALCVLLTCAAAAAAAAPAPAAGNPIGQPAPDFTLPAALGSNVRLSEYLGQPVVLSFWSSRCSLCAAELSALDRYYGTYRSSGLVVLGISVEDDPQRALDYAHAHTTSFPLLLDRSKSVSRAFGIERLPTTILIDRSGLVRYLHGDDRPNDPSYVAQIRALLDDRATLP